MKFSNLHVIAQKYHPKSNSLSPIKNRMTVSGWVPNNICINRCLTRVGYATRSRCETARGVRREMHQTSANRNVKQQAVRSAVFLDFSQRRSNTCCVGFYEIRNLSLWKPIFGNMMTWLCVFCLWLARGSTRHTPTVTDLSYIYIYICIYYQNSIDPFFRHEGESCMSSLLVGRRHGTSWTWAISSQLVALLSILSYAQGRPLTLLFVIVGIMGQLNFGILAIL